MPNEGSGKRSSNYVLVTFTSDLSFMALFASQSVNIRQTVSFYSSSFFLFSPGHF